MDTTLLNRALLAATLVAGTAVFVGCDDGGEDDVSDANANIDAAADDYSEAADEFADDAKDTLENAQDKLEETADQLREQSEKVLTDLQGSELVEHVRMRLGEAQEHIENRDFAGAKSIMDKVAVVRDKLPEAIAEQVDTVQNLIAKGLDAQGAADKVRDLGKGLTGGGD